MLRDSCRVSHGVSHVSHTCLTLCIEDTDEKAPSTMHLLIKAFQLKTLMKHPRCMN